MMMPMFPLSVAHPAPVVVLVGPGGARFELAEPDPAEEPVVWAPPDHRLLALWGRGDHQGLLWAGHDGTDHALADLLWGPAARPVLR